MTERKSCAAPISKTKGHISDMCSYRVGTKNYPVKCEPSLNFWAKTLSDFFNQ